QARAHQCGQRFCPYRNAAAAGSHAAGGPLVKYIMKLLDYVTCLWYESGMFPECARKGGPPMGGNSRRPAPAPAGDLLPFSNEQGIAASAAPQPAALQPLGSSDLASGPRRRTASSTDLNT